MTSLGLMHEVSWAAGQNLAQVMRDLERPGKLDEAFIYLYAGVKAALEAYEIRANRMVSRMRPTEN
jgi:hypothetical protein